MQNFIFRILNWLDPFSRSARKPRRPLFSSAGRGSRLTIQSLETRLAMTAYLVTNTSDSVSAAGSLGYEIAAAVAAQDSSAVITFSGAASNSTIQLGSGDASAAANTAGYGPTAYFVNGASGTNITIDGAAAPGLTIDGGSAVRLFAVTSGDSLTLENLTLKDGKSQGTAGGNGGGGGGAGVGGAVFDDGGIFAALGCTFTNNTAQGGQGGSNSDYFYSNGGCGGGLGGGAA